MKTVSIVCLWLVDDVDNSCVWPSNITKKSVKRHLIWTWWESEKYPAAFETLDLLNHMCTFRRVQTLVLGICICQMETYCNVSVSQHRPTEARAVKLLWIRNMEREQWNQTRTKLSTDAKNIPNKLSNNEQCPRPGLYVLLRLKTRQQASGEKTDTENVGGKTNQTPVWENSLVRSTGSRRAVQNQQPKDALFGIVNQIPNVPSGSLCLCPSLEGLYSKHKVRDEFNITVKGQLNQ